MRWVRALGIVAVGCVAASTTSCVIAELKYSHGSAIDRAAHEMFELFEAGEIDKRPNLDDLLRWLIDEADRAFAAGRKPLHHPGMKPCDWGSVPVLDANGNEVPDAPEFGFVRYSGMPEDPSVTLYTFDRDILAVRVQWEDATPSIGERWRIYDEPRFIECLRAIESAEAPKSWSAREREKGAWW